MDVKKLPALLLTLLPIATATVLREKIVLQPNRITQEKALITPAPATANWLPTRTLKRRDLIDSITGDINSILSGLGSNIPSYVASGIPNFFQDFPTGDKVQSSLGLDDDQVRALPTQVLNVP